MLPYTKLEFSIVKFTLVLQGAPLTYVFPYPKTLGQAKYALSVTNTLAYSPVTLLTKKNVAHKFASWSNVQAPEIYNSPKKLLMTHNYACSGEQYYKTFLNINSRHTVVSQCVCYCPATFSQAQYFEARRAAYPCNRVHWGRLQPCS